MKNLYAIGLHEVSGNFSCGGCANYLLELCYSSPVAVVIEKPTSIAIFQVFCCIRTRFCHVQLYTFAQRVHEVSEQAFDKHNAVALVCIDVVLGDKFMHSLPFLIKYMAVF